MIARFRAVLQGFAGLELVEVDADEDGITLSFGPGGRRWLSLWEQHVAVDGERFRRAWWSGRFEDGAAEAAAARLEPLVGRRLASIEHGCGHRLTLRFDGGGEIRTRTRELPIDWHVDDDRRAVRLDGEVLRDRTRWPERVARLLDDDHVLRVERGGVVGREDGSLVQGLVGLPLTGVEDWLMRFGEDGEPTVLIGRAGIAVATSGGAAEWVRGSEASVTAREVSEAVAPLVGQRVTTAVRGGDGSLVIGFEGGGRVALGPSADGTGSVWTALDAVAHDGLAALPDGSLVAHDEHVRDMVASETGVWGALGVLHARPYRPPRPLPAARSAPRSLVSHVLGGLAGRRLVGVEEADPDGLILRMDPEAAIKLESCVVTVDDGRARVLHPRLGDGRFGDRAACGAALTALVGQTVEAVTLDDDTTLLVSLSDGALVELTPNAWDMSGWSVHDHRTDHCVSAVAELASGGPDAGARLTVERRGADGPLVVGALGTITASQAAGGAAGGGSSLGTLPAGGAAGDALSPVARARSVLAALLGLKLARVARRQLLFAAPDGDGSPVVSLWAFGSSDPSLAAHGERGDGRRIERSDWAAAMGALCGARVVEVVHRPDSALALGFDDGHRLVLASLATVVASWSAGLAHDGPWIAATDDGLIRALDADAGRADAPRALLSGSLGTLPAYGFKS